MVEGAATSGEWNWTSQIEAGRQRTIKITPFDAQGSYLGRLLQQAYAAFVEVKPFWA